MNLLGLGISPEDALWSVGASVVTAVLNQPRLPKWGRVVVLVVVCLGLAALRLAQSHQLTLSSWVSAAPSLALQTAILYQVALKHLGAGWLEGVTSEAVAAMASALRRPMANDPVEDRLRVLESAYRNGLITVEQKRAYADQILKEGLPALPAPKEGESS